MNARFRQFLNALSESFWVLPAALVFFGILMAVRLLRLDRSDLLLQDWITQSTWLYNGGGTGARTLLGVIASSAIGVARNASDREDLYRAYPHFERALEFGVLGALRAVDTDRAMSDLKA